MRRLLYGVLAAGLLLVSAPSAGADDTAKGIIEKAITAHGGADKLAKLQVRQEKSKYTAEAGGQTYTVTTDALLHLPDRRKVTTESPRGRSISVINGHMGSYSVGSQTTEFTDEGLKFVKEQMHEAYVLTLTPLLKDQRFALSALGETKLNDRPALGVKVSAKERRDVDLYFDKETGLLVKSVAKVVLRMQETDQEIRYSGYKDVEGLKWPMKAVQYRNGNKYAETEITELKFLEKGDDSVFSVPKGLQLTKTDLQVLRKADEILSDQTKWNRMCDRRYRKEDKTWSLYTALHKASLDVTGDFNHRLPALEEVRKTVDERTVGKNYGHRLMDYNNDPTTSFADIKKVLKSTIERVSKQLGEQRGDK